MAKWKIVIYQGKKEMRSVAFSHEYETDDEASRELTHLADEVCKSDDKSLLIMKLPITKYRKCKFYAECKTKVAEDNEKPYDEYCFLHIVQIQQKNSLREKLFSKRRKKKSSREE